MNAKLNVTRIANLISLLLVLAMIVVTFLPCWTYETKEKIDGERVTVTKEVSISEFVWFPKEHKDLNNAFEDLYENEEDYFINDMITAPALVLALGIALGVLSLWYPHLPVGSGLALFLGALSAISYNIRPEYALGSCMDIVTLVSYIAAGVGALLFAASVAEAVIVKAKKEKAA